MKIHVKVIVSSLRIIWSMIQPLDLSRIEDLDWSFNLIESDVHRSSRMLIRVKRSLILDL